MSSSQFCSYNAYCRYECTVKNRSCLCPAKVKFSLFFVKYKAMMAWKGGGGEEKVVWFHAFVNFHQTEVSGPVNSDCIIRYTHRMGGLDGSQRWSGQNDEKKKRFAPTGNRILVFQPLTSHSTN